MDEIDKIINMLQGVLPKLIENPVAMRGCDVSEEEISEVIKTNALSLDMLEHLAGDKFFETFNEELGISEEDASEIGAFLSKSGRRFSEELRLQIPYLKD